MQSGVVFVKRLNLFAKGNLDVHDTLHSLVLDGQVRWNGINSLLRERGSPVTIRIRHETSTGSEAVLQAGGAVPPELADLQLPLAPYPLTTQFGRTLFDTQADAYVLSIQPDVQVKPGRHRRAGFLFYPQNFAQWPQPAKDWLQADFEPTRLLPVDEAMANLAAVIDRLRTRHDAPILIYNMSSVIPGETVHCHAGLDDVFSTRIRQFNLALIELSRQTGISIVDIDHLFAWHGASALKFDATHFTELGCRVVAEEVLRILADCGLLPEDGEQR